MNLRVTKIIKTTVDNGTTEVIPYSNLFGCVGVDNKRDRTSGGY